MSMRRLDHGRPTRGAMTSQVIAPPSSRADDPSSQHIATTMIRALLVTVIVAFGILTAAALLRHGY
jgi:hypothetical protein